MSIIIISIGIVSHKQKINLTKAFLILQSIADQKAK